MSCSLDPDFTYFCDAVAYRNRRTDHEEKFDAFRDYAQKNCPNVSTTFVIQFVCHPNFEDYRKEVFYYSFEPGGVVHEMAALSPGFRRANSFKNFKSSSGHPKGLFYELNLYTQDGSSTHHTSRVSGTTYKRDSAHDQNQGTTKGRHWLE